MTRAYTLSSSSPPHPTSVLLAAAVATAVLVYIFSENSSSSSSTVLWAKVLALIMNVFMIIAIILLGCGFPELDDPCRDSHSRQCGLQCAATKGKMKAMILCAPYSLGASAYLYFAGEVFAFIGAFFAACISVPYSCELWGRGGEVLGVRPCLLTVLLFCR